MCAAPMGKRSLLFRVRGLGMPEMAWHNWPAGETLAKRLRHGSFVAERPCQRRDFDSACGCSCHLWPRPHATCFRDGCAGSGCLGVGAHVRLGIAKCSGWTGGQAATDCVGRISAGLNVRGKRGRQRYAAWPRLQKMYTVPVAGAKWHAVGAPLDRGVRPCTPL